ncbi:MAG TPA: ATP-binding protein, partial [Methanoregulaceae archaeon]|nr:ATP-binding protein [Methanoregulaceae archaeon]
MSDEMEEGALLRESSRTGSVAVDTGGRILSADHLFSRWVGTSSHEIVGGLLEDYVCPMDRPSLRAVLSALGGERAVMDVRFCFSGQESVPVRIVVSAGSRDDSLLVKIHGGDSVTRERPEPGEDRFRLAQAILAQVDSPVVVLDAEGRVLMSNPPAQALADRDPVGLEFLDVFPLIPVPAGGADALHPIPGSPDPAGRTGPVPVSGLYRLPARDDRQLRVTAERASGPGDAGGAIGFWLIRLDDVTARPADEERLLRAREAVADSRRELQQFVYAASHDLQEPLRMITSYLQLLERRYAGRLDDEGLEFIGFAVDGASRMQELINALLIYSRVFSRAQPVEPVDSGTAVAEALAHLEQKVVSSGAEIALGPLPIVRADRAQLVQVFEQLIDNALKFRAKTPPRILIDAQRIDGGIRFRVRDNGIGIDPRCHERIFQIFSRLHPRDQYPGTGIGLAVVKRIVERHGGQCWVESTEGAGSTFYFSLPDHPPA